MFVRRPGLAAERVIEIATLMYNSDCQKLPKINYADFQYSNGKQQLQYSKDQHRFTECKQSIEKEGNQQNVQIETRCLKIKSIVRQKHKVVFFFVEQSLLTPDSSVFPRMLLATGVERKDNTKSAVRANRVKKVQLVNLGRFKYVVYKRH